MAEKKKENGGLDIKVVLLVVAAAALVFAGIAYMNQPTPVPPSSSKNQLETPAAKLLLTYYDRGAALQQYTFNYTSKDIAYERGSDVVWVVMSNSTQAYVRKEVPILGLVEGWFGQNSAIDTLCLKNKDDYSCGRVENNSDAKQIAVDLMTRVPNQQIYLVQKEMFIGQTKAGVLLFDDAVTNERVGPFDTQKITYRAIYSNLTVRQLGDIGIQPDSVPEDRFVSLWIDRSTGWVVKTVVTINVNGAQYTLSESSYQEASVGKPAMPPVPDFVVATGSFVAFYKQVARDYVAVTTCLDLGGSEAWSCLKNLGVEKHSWDVCKMITDTDTYEQCTTIVAQDTYNEVLCGKLNKYADDCYIAVVSKKGNFEACQLLKNKSLSDACTAAAAEGKKLQDAKAEAIRQAEASKNCKADADCFAAAPHLCVPKISTGPFTDDTSAYAACFENQPCGCQTGFCGFAKNETYYACVTDVEENALQLFISSEINQSKSNPTNQTG